MERISRYINSLATDAKKCFWLFFVVLVLLCLLVTVCNDPINRGVDFHFHFRRFVSLINALKDGNFPAYIDYNALNGYGYLSNAFYPDLVLVPFSLIGLIAPPLFAYKFALFTMSILCGVITYKVIITIFKSPVAASVAGLLYTFCSYRLFDYFHRSSLGELFTFTFVPIVLLGLYHIIRGDHRKWYIIAIGFSLMIYSHAIYSLLMFITVIVLLLINYKPLIKEPKRLFWLTIAGVVTLIITSYYLLPMIEQMQSGVFRYSESWQTADKNGLSPHWIIAGMTTGPNYLYTFEPPRIGLLLTLVIALRIFVRGKTELLKMADRGVIAGFILLFISSSLFPWGIFPFNKLNFIQFPWRLLEFISFLFAVSGAYYLSQLNIPVKRIFIISFVLVAYTSYLIVNDSKVYNEMPFPHLHSVEPSLENHYLGSGREYLPMKVKSAEELEERGTIFSPNCAVNIKRNKGKLTFDTTMECNGIVELPLIYYKGYKATLGDADIPVSESENGLAQITVNQSGGVEVYYKGTAVQHISFWVSIAAMLALGIYIFLTKRIRNENH